MRSDAGSEVQQEPDPDRHPALQGQPGLGHEVSAAAEAQHKSKGQAAYELLLGVLVLEFFLWGVGALHRPWRWLGVAVAVAAALWVFRKPLAGPEAGRSELCLEFGLNTEGLAWHALLLGPLTLIFIAAAFVSVDGSEHLVPHFLKRALIYPVWALGQNLMIYGLLWPRIHRVTESKPLSVLVTAVLFSALHWPNLFIVYATLAMGLVFASLYAFRPTILVLALCHGLIGAAADEVYDWDLSVGARYKRRQLKLERRQRARQAQESTDSG